jgi:RNA polymerase sigma-70 factor (ECF subfamily)
MAVADEQLMLDYAAGDAAAFEALYARHKGPLYRFVRRSVKDAAQADELFQDVWMRIVEARVRYSPQARFTTWMYTIAHNRLVDHWRAKGLSLVSLDGDEDGPMEIDAGPAANPQRVAEGREALARFATALAALPLAQREAFLLHEEAGMTAAQIAEATGSNMEAAKSRLRYAMDKLREAMGDD